MSYDNQAMTDEKNQMVLLHLSITDYYLINILSPYYFLISNRTWNKCSFMILITNSMSLKYNSHEENLETLSNSTLLCTNIFWINVFNNWLLVMHAPTIRNDDFFTDHLFIFTCFIVYLFFSQLDQQIIEKV